MARVDRRTGDLLRRLDVGDIAVLDQVDLDRATADALVDAGVTAVVNASPSISGRFPNLGPEIVVGAGIVLVDDLGSGVLRAVKEGRRLRIHEGGVFDGEREVGRGTQHTVESIADLVIEAKAGMSAQLEAFSANAIEFLRRERTLILDGVGVPRLRADIHERQVLVVAPGHGHAEDLAALKRYIRAHRPVLVGIDRAAETLHDQGYQPHVIVGDPDLLSTETLRCGAEVVIPVHPDGHVPGLERVQGLGVGAVTFPASGSPEDLALLLADTRGASLASRSGSRPRSASSSTAHAPASTRRRSSPASSSAAGSSTARPSRRCTAAGSRSARSSCSCSSPSPSPSPSPRRGRGPGRVGCGRYPRRMGGRSLGRLRRLDRGAFLLIPPCYHVTSS